MLNQFFDKKKGQELKKYLRDLTRTRVTKNLADFLNAPFAS